MGARQNGRTFHTLLALRLNATTVVQFWGLLGHATLRGAKNGRAANLAHPAHRSTNVTTNARKKCSIMTSTTVSC
eukprot:1225064-Lingulodinium_polyedra.AAC.1